MRMLNRCIICVFSWCTEVKASLGRLWGPQVGSFEETGFAQPASAPAIASACERFIFYPLWLLERGLWHNLKYSQKCSAWWVFPQEFGLPSRGAVVPRAGPSPAVLACGRHCLKAHTSIVTGCNFNKEVLNFELMHLTVTFVILHLWIEM